MHILSCENLSLDIDGVSIFKNLSFSVVNGSITHIIGKNGCGKTSLFRMISSIQPPTSGAIKIDGVEISEIEKPYVNYMGHNIALKDDLTILENIRLFSALYNSEEMIQSALYYFGIIELQDQKLYNLSAGNKQKVALARLMSCSSDLWLLDEVDSHLDEENRALLYNLIATKANNGGIILMTSHRDILIKNITKIDIEDFREKI
ncbi:MAG: heme ABC exporter ATP-binding protein CcmA [Rickettsiaceae bacterium]|nr:heme ABC exporter ATP-binding protein CcmA [Rickettsiaceae bacterium]